MGAYKDQASGTLDQVKGKIKEEWGEATGNPNLEDEGRAQKNLGEARREMGQASERVKGTGEQLKGSVKSAVGKVTGNESLEAEGHVDKAKGKLRSTLNE
jgi:uncharacterized protein YjbJ (UPF0337 family)